MFLIILDTSGSPHYATDLSSSLLHVHPYFGTTVSMNTVWF